MLVKTSPEHVVAVPTDYSNRKMRVCQTIILREVDKALVPALFGRDDHVADNNGFVEEDKEFTVAEFFDDEARPRPSSRRRSRASSCSCPRSPGSPRRRSLAFLPTTSSTTARAGQSSIARPATSARRCRAVRRPGSTPGG